MHRALVPFAGTICLLGLIALPGCKKAPPPLVEVEGIVLLNGSPLAQAQVEFLPDLEDYGAQMNSSGVTDDQGHFTLTCVLKNEPGAVVGKHRVLVTEAPLTPEMRGSDPDSQGRYAKYFAGLKNRPIPEKYGTAGRTDLFVDVTPDGKKVELKLTR
jgi:hypothetical protein